MKTATKKASKKTAPAATEPSANASPRHKALVAAARADAAAPAGVDDDARPAAATAAPTPPAPPADEPRPAWMPTPAELAPAAGPPLPTLAALGAAYVERLRADGASLSTQASYAADFALAAEILGADRDPAAITPEEIADFERHARVLTTKTGRPKSRLTVEKTRRVLRLAFAFGRDAGRLAAVPYAPKLRIARSAAPETPDAA